jgi:hypothetical protein
MGGIWGHWGNGGQTLKVAYQTINAYKFRVMRAMNIVLGGNICFPQSDLALRTCSDAFAKISPAGPNVIAAVDGVVFETFAPTATSYEDGQAGDKEHTAIGQDFNRKGYFAVTAMCFVDARMRFLSVSMTVATSSHDSTGFLASNVGTLLEDPSALAPHWVVVADDAFKSRGHVLSPFAGHSLLPVQRNFNYYVSKLRSVVERAFAIWKGKWGKTCVEVRAKESLNHGQNVDFRILAWCWPPEFENVSTTVMDQEKGSRFLMKAARSKRKEHCFCEA